MIRFAAIAFFSLVTPLIALPEIVTTNYPLTYLTERITGDLATVSAPYPADADPAFWRPDDAAITRMQKADLIVTNGATYEKWLDAVTLPDDRLVDTSAAFADRFIVDKHAHVHSHGPGEKHSHGGTAFTTWLDLALAQKQADAILAALEDTLPDHADTFAENHANLTTDLSALHAAITAATQPLADKTLLASHPIYQYFARAYGLTVASFTLEPEEPISDKQAGEILKKSHSSHAIAFLWEGTPSEGNAQSIELPQIVIQPCMNRPKAGNFLTVMNANLKALRSLSPQQP